jgi:hypothetical protein
LNRCVWSALCQALPQTTGAEPANIVEIGAGIGTMLARMVDWGLLTGPATYLATDCDAGHLPLARRYLAAWAEERGYTLHWPEKQQGRLCTAQAEIELVFETVRAEELARRTESRGTFHLVIAHAVLDLIDLPAVLPGILSQLTNNGLAYCTCHFDGATLFLPEYPGGEEEEILRRYHDSMEARLDRGKQHRPETAEHACRVRASNFWRPAVRTGSSIPGTKPTPEMKYCSSMPSLPPWNRSLPGKAVLRRPVWPPGPVLGTGRRIWPP